MNRAVLLVVVVLGVLLYLRSPIDLVPDRIGLVGVLDDLLVLVVAVWWLVRRWPDIRMPPTSGGDRAGNGSQRAARGASHEGASFDPYRVLGVERGASADEITHAYREQIKLYHPDRVAELGEELRQVAHEKTLEIQRAYETLRR